MISQYLIPMLQERFPDRGLIVNVQPKPIAIFPAIHPEVGNIELLDENDEITLIAGNFTHGHFANYDEGLSVEQKHRKIAEAVVNFLQDLFADQVILWGSHEGGGGWTFLGPGDITPPSVKKVYVWSGPIAGGLTGR